MDDTYEKKTDWKKLRELNNKQAYLDWENKCKDPNYTNKSLSEDEIDKLQKLDDDKAWENWANR